MVQQDFRWDDELTGVARRIAASTHSPLRVKAGPGTGKTYALKRHIARLLQDEHADPKSILVCTFTRTAATDLRRELEDLEVVGIRNVRAGTLHSLCFEILSRNEVLEILGRNPRPLLKFEERFLLEDVKSNIFGGIRDCSKRLKAFDAAWARMQQDQPGWPDDPVDKEFHRTLTAWLIFHKAILIGELVPETLKYLRNNALSSKDEGFSYVLVDEYQDLNKADQVLLDILSKNAKYLIIGDEHQSIYAFRHANPEGIIKFHDTHVNTIDEPLETCRRCPEKVVKMANHLIANNQDGNKRPLQVMQGNPRGEVVNAQWQTRENESKGIAKIIQNRINKHQIAPGEILVLAPSRQIGYDIRNELLQLSIDAQSFFVEEALDGDPKNITKSEAQEAFALLTLLVDKDDRPALRAWCGFGQSSLNRSSWAKLRAYCENTNSEPFEILKSAVNGSLDIPGIAKLLPRFKLLLNHLSSLKDLTGPPLLNKLFPLGNTWSEPFQTIAAWLQQEEDFDADKLHQALRQGITQPELPQDVAYVRIMSLHKSKGLTAKMVVIAGCVEGLIPRTPDDRSPLSVIEQHEEQRRLFYVAITRAKETLLISSFRQTDAYFANVYRLPGTQRRGRMASTIASSFIQELGPEMPNSIAAEELIALVNTPTLATAF